MTDIVEEVLGELQGHTIDIGQMTWLTAAMTDSDLSFTVDTSFTQLSRGVVEVDDELVFVSGVDRDSGTCTVAPFGRGFQATTAAAHSENDRVTLTPRFPRAKILDAINRIVRSVYPTIYAVGQETFATETGRVSYPLNAAAEMVLRVEVSTLGGTSRDWEEVDRWHFNRSADTGSFASGKSLDIYEPPMAGTTIQVTYAKIPAQVISAFADTGLEESAWLAIKFGAAHLMLTGVVAGEAGSESVSAGQQNRAARRDPAAVQREYFTLHRQYLLEERDRLLQKYPPSMNVEW